MATLLICLFCDFVFVLNIMDMMDAIDLEDLDYFELNGRLIVDRVRVNLLFELSDEDFKYKYRLAAK